MKASSFAVRQGWKALAWVGLLALAACGGGNTQVDPFKPVRMVAFGDEHSLLTSDGKRYGVNGTKNTSDTDTTQILDCSLNPVWTQYVASAFALVSAGCNADAKPVTVTYAASPGATVAGVRSQIDQYIASGGPVNATTLITVMAGTHDILALYRQYPTKSEAQLRTEATTLGRELSAQVNRLANAGGRVLVLTIPRVGLTPFGISEKASDTTVDRSLLLNGLSEEFNRALRLNILNDGRLVGLVLADEAVDGLVQFAAGYGLVNVTQAACTAALPNCLPSTLVTDATAATWLWADTLRMGPTAQSQLGQSAASRAVNNPF